MTSHVPLPYVYMDSVVTDEYTLINSKDISFNTNKSAWIKILLNTHKHEGLMLKFLKRAIRMTGRYWPNNAR